MILENKFSYLFSGFYSFFNRHERIGALIVFASVIAFVYAPVVFLGRSFQAPIWFPHTTVPHALTDEGAWGYQGRKPYKSFNVDLTNAAITELPINKLVGNTLKEGKLPLWNPYKGLGEPIPEQVGSSALFPYQMLEDVFPPTLWDFFMLGRLLIAGFFSFLFLRAIGASKIGAFLGGLLYMLSGTFTWFINNEQMVNPAMMLPVVLWGVETLIQQATIRRLVITSVSLGLLIMAGAPGVILYAFLLIGAYAVFRIVINRSRGALFRIFLVVVALILGVSLALPFLLPLSDFLKLSQDLREGLGTQVLNPGYLSFVLFPGLMDLPIDYFVSVGNGLWDNVGSYIGIIAGFLIVIGIIASFLATNDSRKKYFLFFLGAGGSVLLKNYGVPPFVFLGELPLFNTIWSFRWSGPVWGLSFALAAGIGFDILWTHLLEVRSKLRKILHSPGLIVVPGLLMVLVGLWFNQLAEFIGKQREGVTAFKTANPPLFSETALYFSATFIVLFLAAYLLFYSKKGRREIGLALCGLAVVELWLWVPRGYELTTLKLVPFIAGILGVIGLARGSKKTALVWWSAFLVFFIVADSLSPFGLPSRYDPFAEPPYVRFIKTQDGYFRSLGTRSVLMPNTSSAFGISDIRHINTAVNKDWADFKKKVLGIDEYPLWFTDSGILLDPATQDSKLFTAMCGHEPARLTSAKVIFGKRLPFYSLLGVRYILLPRDVKIDDIIGAKYAQFPLVYDGEIKIYENPFVIPRVFMAGKASYPKAGGDVFEALKEIEHLDKEVVLEERLDKTVDFDNLNYTARIESYEPAKVVIDVVASAPGLIVLTDLFYPGWEAKIDNVPQKIYKTDGLFRGVYVEKGGHRVIFEYRPRSFRFGLLIAGAILAILILGVVVESKTNKHRLLFIPLGLLLFASSIFFLRNASGYLSYGKQTHEVPTAEVSEGNALWGRQQKEMLFIAENISKMLPGKVENEDIKMDNFVFPSGALNTYLVSYHEGGSPKRVLVRILKEGDPDYNYGKELAPVAAYLFDEYPRSGSLEEAKGFLPSYLTNNIRAAGILKLLFYYWAKEGKFLEMKLYITTALYEREGGRWVLKEGKALSSKIFDSGFAYDCLAASWKQFNPSPSFY